MSDDIEMEVRKLMGSKKIFKAFLDKIAYLICTDNPTFHERNDVQGTKVYQPFNCLKNYHIFEKERNIVDSCDHYCQIIWI